MYSICFLLCDLEHLINSTVRLAGAAELWSRRRTRVLRLSPFPVAVWSLCLQPRRLQWWTAAARGALQKDRHPSRKMPFCSFYPRFCIRSCSGCDSQRPMCEQMAGALPLNYVWSACHSAIARHPQPSPPPRHQIFENHIVAEQLGVTSRKWRLCNTQFRKSRGVSDLWWLMGNGLNYTKLEKIKDLCICTIT